MNRYSIRDLEKLSGIKAHTIRIWEQRYNLIEPHRTQTNIRFYTDDDLKRLMNISILNKQGLKISKIARLNNEQISRNVIEVTRSHSSSATRIENMIVSMLNLDEHLFSETLEMAIREQGFEGAFEQVLYPFLERIGILWLAGSIIPAQEHFISNLIRQKIIALTDKIVVPAAAKKILFFLPEGEFHELGLLYYNYLARRMGYNTIYIGTSLPYSDLLSVNKMMQIDACFTSFVSSLNNGDIQQAIDRLQRDFPGKPFYLSGRLVREEVPKLPAGFRIIASSEDFRLALHP